MLYDRDIRDPLFDYLEDVYGRMRIIEEKTIGKSRADVMMVLPDSIWGIEIKSDADTYERLERQVKDYNRFFDYNIVAVGTSHAMHIAEHVPDYWGIITIDEGDKPDFYMYREPKPNPKREKTVKFRNQMSMLWRPELAHIQEINGMHKYAQLGKAKLVLKIMDTVPEEALKKQMCEELFERDYTTISDKIKEYKVEHNLKLKKKKPKKVRKKLIARQKI